MAGVKGKSGGARPGAGRKKNPENEGDEFAASTEGSTPLQVLEFFMNEAAVPVALRLKAAQAAAPFRHKKLGESNKADAGKSAVEAAQGGKYATRTGPRGAAMKH
jgi:phage terminase small subunit